MNLGAIYKDAGAEETVSLALVCVATVQDMDEQIAWTIMSLISMTTINHGYHRNRKKLKHFP